MNRCLVYRKNKKVETKIVSTLNINHFYFFNIIIFPKKLSSSLFYIRFKNFVKILIF